MVLPFVLAVVPRVSRSIWQQRELLVMVLELVPKGWLQVLNMEGAEGGA